MSGRPHRMRIVLAFSLALPLQWGCAGQGGLASSTPVPGSSIYCLNTMSTDGFWKLLKASSLSYGPFTRRAIAGNSSICDLTQFYTYTVSWQTKDGRSEQHEFDFQKIMQKFQIQTPQAMNIQRLNGQPDLRILYAEDRIEVSYVVLQYQQDGVEIRNGREVQIKPSITTKFPLLTVPLAPATTASKPP